MTDARLDSCPFCGSTAHITTSDSAGFVVRCDSESGITCSARVVSDAGKDDAIYQWNRRHKI